MAHRPIQFYGFPQWDPDPTPAASDEDGWVSYAPEQEAEAAPGDCLPSDPV